MRFVGLFLAVWRMDRGDFSARELMRALEARTWSDRFI